MLAASGVARFPPTSPPRLPRDLHRHGDGEIRGGASPTGCLPDTAWSPPHRSQVPNQLNSQSALLPASSADLTRALYAECDQLTPPQKQDDKHDDHDDNNCSDSDEHRFPSF